MANLSGRARVCTRLYLTRDGCSQQRLWWDLWWRWRWGSYCNYFGCEAEIISLFRSRYSMHCRIYRFRQLLYSWQKSWESCRYNLSGAYTLINNWVKCCVNCCGDIGPDAGSVVWWSLILRLPGITDNYRLKVAYFVGVRSNTLRQLAIAVRIKLSYHTGKCLTSCLQD